MPYLGVSHWSRRAFLFEGFAVAVGCDTICAQQGALLPESLTEWLDAPANVRKLALKRCLDRIQSMEPSILAWVQVSPKRDYLLNKAREGLG